MRSEKKQKLKKISAAVLAVLLAASLTLPGFVYAEEEQTIPQGGTAEEEQTIQQGGTSETEQKKEGTEEGQDEESTSSENDVDDQQMLRRAPGNIKAIEDDHSFRAVLYDTAEYGSDTDEGIPLTEEGATLEGWDFNTSKYLQIDLSVPSAENTVHIVTVKLPKELYVVGSVDTIPAGFSKVDFEKNEDLSVNGSGTYSLNANSGTLTYYMASNMERSVLQLELRYDNALWDKEEKSSLTAEGVYPIEVSLTHEDTETYPPEDELPSLKLKTAAAGSAMKHSNYIYFARKSETGGYYTYITADKDEELTMRLTWETSSYTGEQMYYQDLVIDIAIPYYETPNGEKHYLNYDEDHITFSSFLNGSPDYTVISREEDNLKIKINAPFFKYGSMVYLPLSYPQNLETDLDSVEFTDGSVTMTAASNNGTSGIQVFSKAIGQITYYVKQAENIVITCTNRYVTHEEGAENALTILGGYYLENQGSAASGKKEIKVTFADGLLVTTMNLLADLDSETVKVDYTLVDKDGEPVYLDAEGKRMSEGDDGAVGTWSIELPNRYYGQTTLNNLYNRLTRSMLPETQQQYFFKTVTYTLESIRAGAKLWASGSTASPTSAGNYFGYLQDNVSIGTNMNSEVLVSSPENEKIPELSIQPYTRASEVNNPPYGIKDVAMSQTSIQAGESVNVEGTVIVASYPYGYNNRLRNIRLGVVLPKGASINKDSIQLAGGTIEVKSLKTRENSSGQLLWIIEVDPDVSIGYYTEALKGLESGDSMKFSFQIDTAKDMNAATLFSDQMLFVAGKDQKNSASGSYSWASYADSWDLNENGVTEGDLIGGSRLSERKMCSIIPNSAVLDISDSIKITGAGTSDGTAASLKAETDKVTYTLDIKCLDGGAASSFEYYIPIPKIGSGRDSYLVGGNEEEAFNFALIGDAAVVGDAIYKIWYSNEAGLTYSGARELTDDQWFSADQINNGTVGFGWSDVTMLKLIAADDRIENGSSTSISLDMQYSGDNYPAEAGMNDIWKSCGYYTYASGSRVVTGHFPTSGCSAVLNYAWSNTEAQESVVLTAAKNMQPTAPNVRVKTIRDAADGGETSFPAFKNAQTFTITDIQTVNVGLQTREYMETNQTTMSGIDANQTFGITVAMGTADEDGDEKDLEVGTEIGTSVALNAPQFTFRLYNADAISDITTERYVVVTLTSNKGVTIRVKIDIKRELALADDPKSAITAGKVYIPFAETAKEVTISQDSAFTAQFIESYIPDLYSGDRTIAFSKALPEGTTLLLADVTDINAPGYWHYRLDGAQDEVTFAQFYRIGTTGTSDYNNPVGNDTHQERLLLVVDFSECAQTPSAADYTVKLTIGGSAGVDDTIETTLHFTTKEKRTFELNGDTSASVNEEYALTYTTVGPGCAESKYDGRRLSAVFTPAEETELPEDAYLLIGNTRYYRNENNQFILPLEQIKTAASEEGGPVKMEDMITLQLHSDALPKAGADYFLKIELWTSATNNGENPLLGEKEAELTVAFSAKSVPQPAWKVTGMEPRLLHKKHLGTDIAVTYQYEDMKDCTVTVELQKKDSAGYVTQTNVMTSVNGSTNHSVGVFTITPSILGKMTFRLSSDTTVKGTYRLLFRVKDTDGTQLLEIPYNFIVAE